MRRSSSAGDADRHRYRNPGQFFSFMIRVHLRISVICWCGWNYNFSQAGVLDLVYAQREFAAYEKRFETIVEAAKTDQAGGIAIAAVKERQIAPWGEIAEVARALVVERAASRPPSACAAGRRSFRCWSNCRSSGLAAAWTPNPAPTRCRRGSRSSSDR